MDLNITTESTSDSLYPENKLPQSCPDWVKVTEIDHPALVPGFISRRECQPDGSFDPNTPSVSLQMSLLHSSGLSPALVSVISNIPSGLMCEYIHKRNLRESCGGEGFVITHSPNHYRRTGDPLMMPSVFNYAGSASSAAANANAVEMANKTASELAALNILYGGVKGKAYLDSLKSFTDGIHVAADSKIGELLRNKLMKIESVCGFKVLRYVEEGDVDNSMTEESLIDQNTQLLRLLNTCDGLSVEARKEILERLKTNLDELMKTCPEEVKNDRFKGVDI